MRRSHSRPACSVEGGGDTFLETMADRGAKPERRRSQRLLRHLPILVKGNLETKGPFTEPTRTVVINAHGALITLITRAALGQELTLTNVDTQEEQECRVVYLGTKEAGRTEVGIAFHHPTPKFWGIAAPPDDWRRFLT